MKCYISRDLFSWIFHQMFCNYTAKIQHLCRNKIVTHLTVENWVRLWEWLYHRCYIQANIISQTVSRWTVHCAFTSWHGHRPSWFSVGSTDRTICWAPDWALTARFSDTPITVVGATVVRAAVARAATMWSTATGSILLAYSSHWCPAEYIILGGTFQNA